MPESQSGVSDEDRTVRLGPWQWTVIYAITAALLVLALPLLLFLVDVLVRGWPR